MQLIVEKMRLNGFALEEERPTAKLFVATDDSDTGVIVDDRLFADAPPNLSYLEYTAWQNRLMHRFSRLYRFAAETADQVIEQLGLLDDRYPLTDDLRRFGRDRQDQDIDPTPPEFTFEQLFERVYGTAYLPALVREYEYFDLEGKQRYVDYMLHTASGQVAIELNGERYHHPLCIGLARYQSQLLKQNSLVREGCPVYRWSNAGMADGDKFADQVRSYFGDRSQLLSVPQYHQPRALQSFQLQQHQDITIERLERQRRLGKNTFLIVLPTGTGKTEIFIEDHARQRQQGHADRALVIVPSIQLKQQTLARFNLRNSELHVGEDLDDAALDLVVQTTAYMVRHYPRLEAKAFDYIVVDEAHHAPAQSLRRILEHFQPSTLMGVTATDQRMDQQALERIFGNYEVDLTLPEAIEQGVLVPIRAFRLETSIDFSQVRFNGKTFVQQDLQKTLVIPSRDALIVALLQRYFAASGTKVLAAKQGVIFCVDIQHAQRMSKRLEQAGISAAAVSGKDRAALADYEKGLIRFICACDLLNEGWDSPQTSILVMARPTLSKVLYLQQLGRGTRKAAGKEALYLIDVVDSYGAALQPLSLHGLFGLSSYRPFGTVYEPLSGGSQEELQILDGLWEGERKLVPLQLFSFDEAFGGLWNEEQLARELFISTGTLKTWIKKGDVTADRTLPFGNKTLNYFSPDQVGKIRQNKGLKERTEATRRDDLFEFLEQRDYSFSFKIVFLLAMIRLMDRQGDVELAELVSLYQGFYQRVYDGFGAVEKAGSPYNDRDKRADHSYMSRSLLQNPFEKFERKRFVYHCKDLDRLAFDPVLFEKLSAQDFMLASRQMVEDCRDYYRKRLNVELDSKFFVDVGLINPQWLTEDVKPTMDQSCIGEVPSSQLPYYPDIPIACGHFRSGTADQVETLSVGAGYGRLDPKRHFVAHARGNSMDGGKKPIRDGDWLLLEWIGADSAGSIGQQTVVIERTNWDEDSYLLRQVIKGSDGGYRLRAFNPDYPDIDAQDDMRTLARLVAVLVI